MQLDGTYTWSGNARYIPGIANSFSSQSYTFWPDGRFQSTGSSSAMLRGTPDSWGITSPKWVQGQGGKEGGKYRITRDTLELLYNDGSRVTRGIEVRPGRSENPLQPDVVILNGERPFVRQSDEAPANSRSETQAPPSVGKAIIAGVAAVAGLALLSSWLGKSPGESDPPQE